MYSNFQFFIPTFNQLFFFWLELFIYYFNLVSIILNLELWLFIQTVMLIILTASHGFSQQFSNFYSYCSLLFFTVWLFV